MLRFTAVTAAVAIALFATVSIAGDAANNEIVISQDDQRVIDYVIEFGAYLGEFEGAHGFAVDLDGDGRDELVVFHPVDGSQRGAIDAGSAYLFSTTTGDLLRTR